MIIIQININYPRIPEEIVVHLGEPDEAAENVAIPFVDYIKNVASSEIYPSWPEAAIEANILAQISFALNRVYNEWYPSKGYTFDITSLPTYDQTFILDRQIFDVISKKVDEIFNNYIYRQGQIQPLYAVYCDGKTTMCNGLSQWGSVNLARQNKSALDILKYYYGDDVRIFEDAPFGELITAYPGVPVELGNAGDRVTIIQRELNRISNNYPAIPKIPNISGVFDIYTENAVKKFQEIFNLAINGIVDYSTWYKIKYIYNAVKRLNDINSEGITAADAEITHGNKLVYSDTGPYIRILHYFLGVISYFDPDLPLLKLDSVFNEDTREMVINFQNKYNIPGTGEVDAVTWDKIKDVYVNTIQNIPTEFLVYQDEFAPDRVLSYGMRGEDVLKIQRYLLTICRKFGTIPGIRVNGVFDDIMRDSVKKIQFMFDEPITGNITPITWYNIVEYSKQT